MQNDDTESLVQQAVNSAKAGKKTFCKFLSANDTGATKSHQCGILIPNDASALLLREAGQKGTNLTKNIKIHWQDGSNTDSTFKYYGVSTRNEYRITRFGRGFEFLRPVYTGALFVLNQLDDDEYQAWVLNKEDDIDAFLDTFGLSPEATNKVIGADQPVSSSKTQARDELAAFSDFIESLRGDFPDSVLMSKEARSIENRVYNHKEKIITEPDWKLVHWLDVEYRLFQALERDRYQGILKNGFSEIDDFIKVAQTILNRRKSRAGKSLEHHLSALFSGNNLTFEEQVRTEGNKRPDFVFPSAQAYHDPAFNAKNLVTLAAKTTCKDRWRQILSEADRVRNDKKYLCTLQRGISPEQLTEMATEKVVLVVPKKYISEYPKDFQDTIWTLEKFIAFVKDKGFVTPT